MNESLHAAPMANAGIVYGKAKTLGAVDPSGKPGFLLAFLKELYRLAPLAGLSPDWLAVQASHETDIFRSPIWVARGNPAGIGVTDGTDHGYAFATGEDAARAMCVHMSGYVNGRVLPGVLLAYYDLDPRWEALVRSGMLGSVATIADLGNGRWASDPHYAAGLRRHNDLLITPTPQEGQPMADITFGRVPHPEFVDMTWIARNKNEGVGWDNLGQRKPKFIALHRMWGTLVGTDNYFAPANSPHLTDYAIGCAAIDGKAKAGEIHKYNDPLGFRSGWASGRVSAPYGDGKAIVDKYGINAVNRDGISIEMSGYDTTPIDEVTWKEYVALIAYWIDYMEIPYTSLPINPHTGISAFIWHQEFTIGTGKKCPFKYLMDNTTRLIADVAAYLKPYQSGTIAGPGTKPEIPPVVTPIYAPPVPIAELAAYADTDRDVMTALATREADQFIYVGDTVEAVQDTPRLQTASADAKRTGPDIEAGEQFRVDWMVKAADRHWYYITPYWTRVRVDHTKRVLDAEEAA